MKSRSLWLIAAGALALTACAAEHTRVEYRASGGSAATADLDDADAYDMAYDERHREWWTEHEKDRAFERRAALSEHRTFCERYPDDASCEGWFHR